MDSVDTLIVCAINRGHDIAADLLDGLRWGCVRPFHLILIDDVGNIEVAGPDVTVIRSAIESRKEFSGFKNNEGIVHAIAAGLEFEVVLCLDDDVLPIGRGFDDWACGLMDRYAVDLLGVGDRIDYSNDWPDWKKQFGEWVPEAVNFIPVAEGVFYSATWLSRYLVLDLASRGLLVPPNYEQWTLWPDVYISWMAQALGHHVKIWGTMDAPVAPLYANHPDTMTGAPQPWILRSDFSLYHSIRAIPAVSEAAVRHHYRRLRSADVLVRQAGAVSGSRRP
jgi:glycosyltransferase involved in cell wall biosynthesis